MRTPALTPHITVQHDGTHWTLVATSYSQTMPAGERLFKGEPWPDIKFSHSTQARAEADAALLQSYLDNPPKRGRTKSPEAGDERTVEVVDAVWMV